MGTSIVDYNSLITAVANWMMRANNADLIANVPDFIAFAENRFMFGDDDPQNPTPALRVADMEVLQTSVTFLASTNTVTLPSDFLQLRRIYENSSQTSVNFKNKLKYLTPNQMDETTARYPNGPPNAFFTIIGNNLVLAANVNTADTVIFSYYQKIPALSSSNTINWLIQKDPQLYLDGALLEAAVFLRDAEDGARFARRVAGKIRAYRKQDLNSRYSGDALQIRTDVGNP